MRCVLEIRAGGEAGRKIWLLEGQAVTVGRHVSADFVIAQDPRLSSRHFEVRCGTDACVLRDLNSTNGTFVNGTRIREQTLRDGDEILAGQTQFAVQLPSDAPRAAPTLKEPRRADAPRSNSPATPSVPPVNSTFPQLPMLVLDVETTSSPRRRIWLRPEHAVRFGRSSQNDQSFPQDERMSGQHFIIEPTTAGWRCRDLGSTNGTYLNQQLIAECLLSSRDALLAGNTCFRVGFPEDSGPAEANPADRPVPTMALRPPRLAERVYRPIGCRSGLMAFLGQKSGFDPVLVAASLCTRLTPVALGPEAAWQALTPLPPSVPLATPSLGPAGTSWIAVLTPAQCNTVIASTWGQNALTIGYCRPDIEQVGIALARSAEQLVARQLPQFVGWSPSALAEFLGNSERADIAGIFPPWELLLLEAHAGDRWLLLGPPSAESYLQLSGFRPAQLWE
ncbi:MAG: FHA domain-containing protein [Pirellulaceae bacterium]